MIVGFSFQKIAIEKKSNPTSKVTVKNNLDIKDCKEENLVLKDKKGANFNFRFTVDYEPNVAGIEIVGNVIYHAESLKTDFLLVYQTSFSTKQEKLEVVT